MSAHAVDVRVLCPRRRCGPRTQGRSGRARRCKYFAWPTPAVAGSARRARETSSPKGRGHRAAARRCGWSERLPSLVAGVGSTPEATNAEASALGAVHPDQDRLRAGCLHDGELAFNLHDIYRPRSRGDIRGGQRPLCRISWLTYRRDREASERGNSSETGRPARRPCDRDRATGTLRPAPDSSRVAPRERPPSVARPGGQAAWCCPVE